MKWLQNRATDGASSNGNTNHSAANVELESIDTMGENKSKTWKEIKNKSKKKEVNDI